MFDGHFLQLFGENLEAGPLIDFSMNIDFLVPVQSVDQSYIYWLLIYEHVQFIVEIIDLKM